MFVAFHPVAWMNLENGLYVRPLHIWRITNEGRESADVPGRLISHSSCIQNCYSDQRNLASLQQGFCWKTEITTSCQQSMESSSVSSSDKAVVREREFHLVMQGHKLHHDRSERRLGQSEELLPCWGRGGQITGSPLTLNTVWKLVWRNSEHLRISRHMSWQYVTWWWTVWAFSAVWLMLLQANLKYWNSLIP